jgi:thioredoxin-related protein
MNRQMGRLGRYIMTGLFVIFSLASAVEIQAKTLPSEVPQSGIQLIMFEQDGCHYCQVWDDNIGGIYHNTPEGKFAPLRKVDIHTDDDVANVKPVIFTPTFVLYKNGREVGRLTGYISDDFFWGMLEPMLKKHGYGDKVRESKVSGQKGRIN